MPGGVVVVGGGQPVGGGGGGGVLHVYDSIRPTRLTAAVGIKTATRDLAPEAKVLRCCKHHATWEVVAFPWGGGGTFHEVGAFHGGWHIPGGRGV